MEALYLSSATASGAGSTLEMSEAIESMKAFILAQGNLGRGNGEVPLRPLRGDAVRIFRVASSLDSMVMVSRRSWTVKEPTAVRGGEHFRRHHEQAPAPRLPHGKRVRSETAIARTPCSVELRRRGACEEDPRTP